MPSWGSSGQANRSILGDDQGVLVMRREAAITRSDRPSISLQNTAACPGGDDWLDGDDQSLVEPGTQARVIVVGHARRLVNGASHAVPAQLSHHVKSAAL